MKKIILLFVLMILLMPMSKSIYYSTSGASRNATFISKYSSRSMDTQTLDYYERIKQNYNVYIIKDLSVATNAQDWKSALDNSDLIFVTELSDDMLNKTKDSFCKNLASSLNKSVGLVFAGNSLTYYSDNATGNISGCLYTQYFNFADPANNTELTKSEVKISELHEMTDGYAKDAYSLGESGKIYPVVFPKSGSTLGTVNGDPDGTGAQPQGDYPLFVLWRGIRYDAVSWGITTSKLTGCDNCLGWDLFDQFLDWVSDKNNMGFDVDLDKNEYYSGDRISIEATSDINMRNVKGSIIYPESKIYELAFTGSGGDWNSVYLLEDQDPPGEYIIFVNAEGLEVTKKIQVKAMNIDVSINNSTENVGITAELTNKYDQRLTDSQIYISVAKPSTLPDVYEFNSSYVKMIYNVTESGFHTVYITGKDSTGRIQSITKSFYFKMKPSMSFTPESIIETVNDIGPLTKALYFKNEGNETLTNIEVRKGGDIKDWMNVTEGWRTFNQTKLDLGPKNSSQITLLINVPSVGEGQYKGFLNFTSDQGFSVFYITINLDYLGKLQVSPSTASEWIGKDQTKEIEYTLSNIGKGSIEIKSIQPSSEIEDMVYVEAGRMVLPPGGQGKLNVLVSTEGLSQTQVLKTVSGRFVIATDLGPADVSPSLTLNMLSDISKESEKLFSDLIEIDKKIENLREKTDVSEFRDETQQIRSKIENVKELYNNGQLESSYDMYSSLKSDLDALNSKIDQKEDEISRAKKTRTTITIIIIALAIIIPVAYIFYKRTKETKEYSWLYKKWKNR